MLKILFAIYIGTSFGLAEINSKEKDHVGTLPKYSKQFVQRTREAQKIPSIHWNTSNPIFRIDNTDHIVDVNQGVENNQYDQVNIYCPLYAKDVPLAETERSIIYSVNKEEYDTCRIMTGHPKIVFKCDNPYILKFKTISFRPFSPMPGAIEFHPGKDYHFISTSSASNIDQRNAGICRTNNMKLVFKVSDNVNKKHFNNHSHKKKKENVKDSFSDINGHGTRHKKGKNGLLHSGIAAEEKEDTKNTLKPYDYFLHQTKEHDKALFKDTPTEETTYGSNKKDNIGNKKKNLVKQEASTSNSANGHTLYCTFHLTIYVYMYCIPLLYSKLWQT